LNDPKRATFNAILAQHQALSGVRLGQNECKIYPRTPLYQRFDLSTIKTTLDVSETNGKIQTEIQTEIQIECIQQVLLGILAAIGGAVLALISFSG
jgi:hypothetical protein